MTDRSCVARTGARSFDRYRRCISSSRAAVQRSPRRKYARAKSDECRSVRRVTTLRPFLLGLLLALVLVLIALAAEGYHAGQLFWLGLLPVLALHAAAVFTPIAGYRRRLVRGALGFLAAAAVGLP